MSQGAMENYADIQSRRIAQVVDQTRRALLRRALWTGACWFFAAILAWVVAAVALDLVWPLPVAGRVIAFSLGIGVATVALFFFLLRPLYHRPDEQHTAFLIERTMPGIHSRLVTALDIRRNGDPHAPPRDPAFVRRLMEQTTQRLTDFRVGRVVEGGALRAAAVMLAALLLLAAVSYALLQDRATTALSRLLHPTAPIPPASWVRYTALPGDAEILQGEPALIHARFDRGGPATLTVRLRTLSGVWQRYPMPPDDHAQPAFTISAVNESCEYQIEGGGTWTPVHRVTMLRRPIVEKLGLGVRWPDYMGVPAPHPIERIDAPISAPQGSTIQVAALVSGEPVSGRVRMYKAVSSTKQVERDRETVWFDDDVPVDAEVSGTWNWTADHVLSGARACAPHWSRKPFGFTTRLYRARLQPDSSFFMYVFTEPDDLPKSISIRLTVQDKPYTAVWRSTQDKPRPGETRIELGALPAAGEWKRIEIPVATLLGSRPGAAVVLSGIEISTDGGRVYFDRAGNLERRTETVTEQTLEPGESISMEKRGVEWVGSIPVQHDGLFSLEFVNSRNDPNPAMKPIPFAGVPDQPPTLLVEKPAQNITLTQPEPIPLMVRAFDDYGLADIGVEYGPDPAKPAETRWIAHFDKPEPSQLLFNSLDPTAMQVTPGQATQYRIVARDRKGQVARSESYRLALVAPNIAPPADAAAPAPPLKPLIEGLADLIGAQTKLAGAAVDAVARLPDAAKKPAPEFKHDRLVKDDRSTMSPEEIRAFHKRRIDALGDENRKDLAKLDDDFAAQRERALRMAQKIEEAARDAAKSPTAIPAEIAAMENIAKQVRDIAKMEDIDRAFQEAAALGRSVQMRDLTQDQRRKLEQLQRELSDLAKARESFKNNPNESQQEMSALLADLEASRALSKMNQLAEALGERGDRLDELKKELDQLRERAEKAPASEMGDVSQDQSAFDAEAIRAMEEDRNLLADQMAGRAMENDEMPPEPWEAPGQTKKAKPPKEADTPDPKKKEAGAAGGAEPEKDPDWWDRPMDEPVIRSKLEEDPHWEDRDKRPVESDPEAGGDKPRKPERPNHNEQEESEDSSSSKGAGQESDPNSPPKSQSGGQPSDAGTQQQSPQTPRQSLGSHQRQMARQISNRQRQLESARQQVKQLASELDRQAQQMRGSPPKDAAQMASALSRALSSEAVRRAMSAGDRAASSKQEALRAASSQGTTGQPSGSQQPGGTSLTGGRPGSQSPTGGAILDFAPGDLGPRAVAIYRLPPRLREPLIQGMRERGPEAYQTFIDAYYRSLSKDAK
ncbi:MAG: hypothetical protein K8S99_18675 [Planctomycetes bacterium]|nr:hypothetical protein [Planctomycetota bacterium]